MMSRSKAIGLLAFGALTCTGSAAFCMRSEPPVALPPVLEEPVHEGEVMEPVSVEDGAVVGGEVEGEGEVMEEEGQPQLRFDPFDRPPQGRR